MVPTVGKHLNNTPSMLNSRDCFDVLYKSLDSFIPDVWMLFFNSLFGTGSCSQAEARAV